MYSLSKRRVDTKRPLRTTIFLSPTIILSLCLSVAILTSTTQSAFSKDAAAVLGVWKTHQGELIRFINCGKRLCGKLIRTRSKLKKDTNNPNPKLRKRAIKGLTIIRSHKKTGPKKWSGTVYNIQDGKTYRGALHLTSTRSAKLTGCSSSGFCQTATWTKISKTPVLAFKK